MHGFGGGCGCDAFDNPALGIPPHPVTFCVGCAPPMSLDKKIGWLSLINITKCKIFFNFAILEDDDNPVTKANKIGKIQ